MKRIAILSVVTALLLSASAAAQKFDRSVRTADNREPAIPRVAQDSAAAKKLAALRASTGKQPNIMWIIVDDMGYGDPGCFGGGGAAGAATPNMDRLAREGLRLTSCYAQQTCTPTRSAILTGRLPVRTGLIRPILAGDKITKNPGADEVSLPTLLGAAGYKSLLTGKWHVGETKGMRPHDVGFDEFYGFYPAQKEITQRVDARRYPSLLHDKKMMAAFEALGIGHHLEHGFKGGRTEKVSSIDSTEDMARADQVLADFTVQKIQEMAKGDQPFFIEHCFMKVHCDNFAHPDWQGKSASKYPYTSSPSLPDITNYFASKTRSDCVNVPTGGGPNDGPFFKMNTTNG